MDIKLNNNTKETLEHIAELKEISTEQAAIEVLESHASGYLLMLRQARRAAERAMQNYDK